MTRVLIDAVAINTGGALAYLISLLPKLDDLAEQMRIYVLTGPQQWKTLQNSYQRIQWIDCGEKPARSILARRKFYRHAIHTILREYQIDVHYAAAGLLPQGVERHAATVYCPQNMLPFVHHERAKYSVFGRKYWRLRMLEKSTLDSLQRADVVILISRYGRQVLERRVPGIRKRSRLVYHGIPKGFHSPSSTDASDLVEGDYILYISQIDRYKYHSELVEALDILRRERSIRPNLVLAGAAERRCRIHLERQLHRRQLADQVTWLGVVDHARLPALIRNARFCVYSSGVEFCPIAVLEMMGCGAAMAISNRGPMPEIARDGAVYYDPANPSEIAEAIALLYENPERAAELGGRAKSLSNEFSWSLTAKGVVDALRQAEKTYRARIDTGSGITDHGHKPVEV